MTTTRAPVAGRRTGLWILFLVAGLAGAVLVVVGFATQQPAAPRLDEPTGALPTSTRLDEEQGGSTSGVTPARKVPLGASEPTSIVIPAIDVDARVFSIGKAADGSLAVPQPGPRLDDAAWFENSPTPGQPGPSIIEGHVATDEGGPSVFFDLARLRPGDTVAVERRDGTTAEFTIRALREFDKDAFPTELIYGGDIGRPTLRLITCSGFDPSVGAHTANLVVFAVLTQVTKA